MFGQQNGSRVDPDTIEYYQKNIWAGKPKTPTITGPSTLECDAEAWLYGDATSTIGLYTAESFQWNYPSGIQAVATYNNNPPRIRVKALTSGTHTITLTAINDCGSTISQNFYLDCMACDTLIILTYPNPASNELTVSIQDNLTVTPEYEVEIIDSYAIKRKQKKTKERVTQFNIQNIPDGKYLVKVKAKVDGKIVKEKSINFIIAR